MVQDTPVTDRDFAALFREEAGSILTEQQINDEIEREQTRSAQAARAGLRQTDSEGSICSVTAKTSYAATSRSPVCISF